MKTAAIFLTTLVGLMTTVDACFQVHAYYRGDPFAGDVLSIQVEDNDVEVCNGGKTVYAASEETEFCLEAGAGCNDGYRVCLTNFGKEGYAESRQYILLKPRKSQTDVLTSFL